MWVKSGKKLIKKLLTKKKKVGKNKIQISKSRRSCDMRTS